MARITAVELTLAPAFFTLQASAGEEVDPDCGLGSSGKAGADGWVAGSELAGEAAGVVLA
jgi:hypothetical protein